EQSADGFCRDAKRIDIWKVVTATRDGPDDLVYVDRLVRTVALADAHCCLCCFFLRACGSCCRVFGEGIHLCNSSWDAHSQNLATKRRFEKGTSEKRDK